MLNRSASLAMSTSVLKASPGKFDIKRHSPSILYFRDKWNKCMNYVETLHWHVLRYESHNSLLSWWMSVLSSFPFPSMTRSSEPSSYLSPVMKSVYFFSCTTKSLSNKTDHHHSSTFTDMDIFDNLPSV